VSGTIPSVKLYEDEQCVVILDKFPATRGQALVLPKIHEDYIMKIEDSLYSHLFHIAKITAHAIDRALKTKRTCLIVEGFEIPHVHIRLHPCYESVLKTKGVEAQNDELKEVAALIRGDNKG
jgi:histidine triad (HIT) family protein